MGKAKVPRAVLLGAALFISAAASSATTHELILQPGPDVGKDAFVWWWYGNTNYADKYKLWVYGKPGEPPDGDVVRSYVEFVKLGPYVGSRYECLKATLSLYWYSYNHSTGPAPWLCVYRAAGPWKENKLTWNKRPGYVGGRCVYPGPAPKEPGWVNVDVTKIVIGWFLGEYKHYGFVVRLVDENHNYRADFYSSDNPHDEKPKLYIKYRCTNVEPASLGKIKTVNR
jgi:hypothetical protein